MEKDFVGYSALEDYRMCSIAEIIRSKKKGVTEGL